jgi:hypothetical protein
MDDVSVLIFAVLGIMLIIIGVAFAKQVVKRRILSEAETPRMTLGRDWGDD